MPKKVKKHCLDIDKAMQKAKDSLTASKSAKYNRKQYVEELVKEQEVVLTVQTTVELKKALPYTITLLVAMAKKAGCTVDELIKEI